MVEDIHDSIDAEFDLIVPPEPDDFIPIPDEPVQPQEEMHISIPEQPQHETPSIPEKGLTAWLYHMHLKTQLSRRR